MEVTNGTVDPAHYGPIGDAARHVASYCNGASRAHVYTAAFTALAAKEAELAAERVEAYTARHMREIAQGLGYPSILEALEDVSELRAEVEKLRVVVAGAYFEGFSDGPGNDDDAIACWQQSEARATLAETQP